MNPLFVLAFLLGLTVGACPQTVGSLDELLAFERSSLSESCKSIEFADGFLTRHNVDGDGRDDVVVDYESLVCDGSRMMFCGSAGCSMTVYLQGEDGGYSKVADFFGYGFEFDQPNATPPTFIVAIHGNECARSGIETCRMRYKLEDGTAVEVGEVKPEAPD